MGVLGKSPNTTSSLTRLPIYSSRSVQNTIKKFDNIDSVPKNTVYSNKNKVQSKKESTKLEIATNNFNNHFNKHLPLSQEVQSTVIERKEKLVNHKFQVDEIIENEKTNVISHSVENGNSKIEKNPYPSSSLLKKTQSVLAKENGKDQNLKIRPSGPQSPDMNKKDITKPKSASFQKAAAFWNSPKI